MKDLSTRNQTEIRLQQQLEKERLIAQITDAIRRTLDLDQILQSAVEQVRHLLQTDRVIVLKFYPGWLGVVEAESVMGGWSRTLGIKIQDSCLGDLYTERYPQGRVSTISDIDTADIDPDHKDLLLNLQVQANLVVPILQEETLWGLLVAHHCTSVRHWKEESVQLLQQVASQMGIAIQQAELHQKTREQAALIDIAADAIFVRDLAGCLTFWSRGAERLYGWQATEALGKIAHQLLHKKDPEKLALALETTLSQGFWQGDLMQETKAGSEILVASRWTLVRDQAGRPQSLLEMNTDITEQKKLEAQFYQAQRLESLGQLAGGIAHDLVNVLTPILGVAQLLRITQKDMDKPTQQHLALLEKSARRGVEMVRQILTFAQGSSETETIVDVATLLQEVIDVVRQGFPSFIEIEQIAPPSEKKRLLRTVLADSTHLHQVFMNLCINARDAMPKGGLITFFIDNCLIDEAAAQKSLDMSAGNYVVVTVADTGMGISPEVRDRMFDPFFTTKSPSRGTGLGLATVLGIVKKAGGFLRVHSKVGEGTQVEVYFPVAS